MKGSTAYTGAAFLSAFLLFQLQPMAAKALLPVFGGSYMVWGVCVVFFQLVLLLGYWYAHWAQRRFGVRRYAVVHRFLVLIPLLFFPFRFGGAVSDGMPPAVAVLLDLTRTVGLPFFFLATASLVLQRWLAGSDTEERANPYVLYGASNLGSMMGLLAYPLAVERLLPLEAQGRAWWALYVGSVLLYWLCPLPRAGRGEAGAGALSLPGGRRLLQWFLLGAAPCFALLAFTNVITFDIAPAPLLWAAPLAVYLSAFVLAFKRKPWNPRWMGCAFDWALLVGTVLCLLSRSHLEVTAAGAIVGHLLVLFVICLVCALRLIALRPENHEQLTVFYLVMAAGGLAGGSAVNWLVPLVATSLAEHPFAFVVAALAVAVAADGRTEAGGKSATHPARWIVLMCAATATMIAAATMWLPRVVIRAMAESDYVWNAVFSVAAAPLAFALRWGSRGPWRRVFVVLAVAVGLQGMSLATDGGATVRRLRNFYGIYRVYDLQGQRYLRNGTTVHGRQYLEGPKRDTPLTYYHPSTPAAGVLAGLGSGIRRAGMIGLGAGSLAVYFESGTDLAVYELDPDCRVIAEEDFSYLSQARKRGVEVRFVFGDGRIRLREREADSLDVLIIDAFSSGSIPVHLLTVEAMREYGRALGKKGILLLHVSNRFVDLVPVVYASAAGAGFAACKKSNFGEVDDDASATIWMALSADGATVNGLVRDFGWSGRDPGERLPRAWTDAFSDIVGAMCRSF